MTQKYDAIIIGAGMSGLAAGIRLSMFDKKVLILEKHVISGGLNSYYSRRIKETKEMLDFDVGLHALTNFAKKGERKKPLTKLLKQLRIPYDALSLEEQTYSQIKFASASLNFSNDFELLKSEIHKVFPREIDNFNKFVTDLINFNEVDLNANYTPSRVVLDKYFSDELLKEMLIAPLLIYGSAWENDMDFSQFVIMFKSIYMEGFSRPKGGVRSILNILLDKIKECGCELRFRTGVEKILKKDGNIVGVVTTKGEEILCDKVFSSAGLPETYAMVEENEKLKACVGKLSFMETILVMKDKTPLKNIDPTIIFYNKTDKYRYQKSTDLYDTDSAVFCMPDNYNRNDTEGYGVIRATYMANYKKWNDLDKQTYKAKKENVLNDVVDLSKKLLDQTSLDLVFSDVFSPTTIKKYTKHFEGTVYGSPDKVRDGKTQVDGLYIIGTDQGFLGIVGAMLSGISIANLYGLMESR